MQAQPIKASVVSTSFKPEVILVDSDEYLVAFGYSELLGEHCIGEKWKDETRWFQGHPKLTNSKLLSLVAANMEGTKYDDLIDLGNRLGILLLKDAGLLIREQGGMDVYLMHEPITGNPPDVDPGKDKRYN
jgi:hypothetical protein